MTWVIVGVCLMAAGLFLFWLARRMTPLPPPPPPEEPPPVPGLLFQPHDKGDDT